MDSGSIFISYSSKDRPFAMGFAKELQKFGLNVWIDQLNIELGDNWDNSIEEALEKSTTFVLLISPTAVKSQNVQDEVSLAINSDKEFVPILLKPCELPMRWQRRQYADLSQNPEKGLKEIIETLELESAALSRFEKLLGLIGKTTKQDEKKPVTTTEQKGDLKDLLTSEDEFNYAISMTKKGIKKNKQLIIYVALVSVMLLATLLYFKDFQIQDNWEIIAGSLSLNLLSIRPFGGIKKRERIIGLIDLLKIKRARLIRIVNKLADDEIDKFNLEFENCLSL